jgi:thymidylate synthase (FAD)
MRIIRPYAKLFAIEQDVLRSIERAARVSHRSEDMENENSTERFIKDVVVGHGDWSVVEHITARVEFYVDRGITHEIVRHRLFSYTQESTRFVNYEKRIPPKFIYPKIDVECEHCLVGKESRKSDENTWYHDIGSGIGPWTIEKCLYDQDWLVAIDAAETQYRNLLIKGWRPQEARSVFPNALASKIIMTGNLRAWRHFLIMRTTKEAHPQMRQVTIPLLGSFKSHVSILFDDIQPEARQIDNLRLPQ